MRKHLLIRYEPVQNQDAKAPQSASLRTLTAVLCLEYQQDQHMLLHVAIL